MKALVEGLGDITAHVDCHNIISQVSDYCLFYPRFANQPNNVMTEMLSEISDHGDYVTWGSSTLASFSNWVGIKHGTTSSYLKCTKAELENLEALKRCGVQFIT